MFSKILREEWRLLTFRKAHIDLAENKYSFLFFSIFATWVAGVGRYWDHPNAFWWQYAGLGSVVYVGVLSILLWLIVLPLRPRKWSFIGVYIFVGLTAPPAWLYAVPVERFMSLEAAALTNMIFLLIVASWRVALYGVYLKRAAGLSGLSLLSALFLPLAAIVSALAFLNLEHAVFEIMGGLDREPTAADSSYHVVMLLSVVSFLATPVLLLFYFVSCFRAWKHNYH